MTSTYTPTNVQTPFGSRFEPCFPGYEFGKQMFGKQFCEPCPPMMQPYPSQFGGFPWTTYQHQQFQPNYYGSHPFSGPMWCGPEQYQHQHQYQQYQHQFGGYNQTFCNVPCRPTNHTELHCFTNPIRILDREGNRCCWYCLDMRSYKPEECCVTLNKTERCFIIECNQECKEGKEHHVQRRCYRKICLPEHIKCDLSKCEPRCYMNQEGYLTIECQLPKMTPEEMSKCCPTTTCPGCCQPGYQSQQWCNTPVNCKVN